MGDSELHTTVGEFVEGLLCQDRYYTTVFPRLPMSIKKQLEVKLATIPQYRKRTKCNLELLDVFHHKGVRIEANIDGEWIPGTTVELIEDAPSRLKLRVNLENDTVGIIHIGKV